MRPLRTTLRFGNESELVSWVNSLPGNLPIHTRLSDPRLPSVACKGPLLIEHSKGSLEPRLQIAGLWFSSRTIPGNSSEPRTGSHRVSGNSQRSANNGRGGSGHGVGRASSDVNSSAGRAVA